MSHSYTDNAYDVDWLLRRLIISFPNNTLYWFQNNWKLFTMHYIIVSIMHVYCKKCAKIVRLFDLDMSGTLVNINLKGIVGGQ